jgi:uncharacterized protein
MFFREITVKLNKWAEKDNRKPLIIRGARQVGKTSAIRIFAQRYKVYIELNLERKADRVFFDDFPDVIRLFDAVCLNRALIPVKEETLLFIDEIQNSPAAVAMLRYFHEDMPWLHVIAAGSLLETMLAKKVNFPVGRVEFLPVRPCSFREFLAATGNHQSLEILGMIPVPDYANGHLMQLFNTFANIGGMPEIIGIYAKEKSVAVLQPVYDALITTYLEDVEKYARNSTLDHVIKHTIQHAFKAAGSKITFYGFGNSLYKNREMSEAFRTLERTYLLQLIYPVTSTRLPVSPNIKRSPKLQMVDTGLVNYMMGIQVEILRGKEISDLYMGRIADHIAGQELLTLTDSVIFKLNHWTRENKNAKSEVDFVWIHRGLVIPIEVKSGKSGKLRSLHQFMDEAPHQWAVRIYSGKFGIEQVETTAGKPFWLMNLPFYLINRLPDYLDYLMELKNQNN